MEIAFRKEAGCTVFEDAQIAFVAHEIATAFIEIQVAADIGFGDRVACPRLVFVTQMIGPAFFGYLDTLVLEIEGHAVFFFGCVITAIEEQSVVGV